MLQKGILENWILLDIAASYPLANSLAEHPDNYTIGPFGKVGEGALK